MRPQEGQPTYTLNNVSREALHYVHSLTTLILTKRYTAYF